MRQLAFQIVDVVAALWRTPTMQNLDELKTIALFCGAGLDASLWSLEPLSTLQPAFVSGM